MDRKATAKWSGSSRQGQGVVSGESGSFHHIPFSFRSRFKTTDGTDSQSTNPEELIAAAHASCYSMALAAVFDENNVEVQSMEVSASVSLSKVAGSWEVVAVHLILHAEVPGLDDGLFRDLAWEAKEKCPVSKLLRARVSIDAFLNDRGARMVHHPPMQIPASLHH